MTEYLDLFVDEGIESIDAMNNGLLALENDPTDPSAIDSVFRHAHTLKGNAAAVGITEISDLAHVLEDILDQVRGGTVSIDGALMDEMFAAVDRIETLFAEIDQFGETQSDTSDIVERLKLIHDNSEETSKSPHPEKANGDLSTDGTGSRARVTVGNGGMLGVDATFVLAALDDVFGDLEVDPPRERLETGEFDGTFDVAVTTDEETLEDILANVPQIDEFELHTTSDTGTGDDATTSRDTEIDHLSSVRVDIDRLVELNELVEQLVTSRIRINREFELAGIDSDATHELEKVSQRLRDVAMEMRLVPFDTISRGFPRVVRDTARELDKEIEFSMSGTEVEVDRSLLTRMKDPLIHVVRNAVDHGIEPKREREAAGKPPAGQVEIDVRRERDQVVVEVCDDGGGIDVESVKSRALDEGIATATELDTMPNEEIYGLLFHAGLSTASEVTDVSGRGVGMDVVHETVTDLDGMVTIESEPGDGTTVRFRLPVTMAVADVMLIRSDDQLLGIPISDIEEVTSDEVIKQAHGQPMAERQENLSPVIDLEVEFQQSVLADGGTAEPDLAGKSLVLIRKEKRDVALACDEVVGQEEVVVKPLADILSGTPGVSGTAVLGDQQLVPIIDVVSI